MTRVILATCADLPEGDEDAELVVAALRGAGLDVAWQVWNDPAAAWDAPTVIRSTWDYTTDCGAFSAWARSVPQLFNPYEAVLWSSDKVYLAELAEAGLPVVLSAVYPPGEQPRFPAQGEFVVKPSVGAGSRGCGRFAAGDHAAAAEHAAGLHAEGRTVLVQPYLDQVDAAGETALLYFDGGFSHAIEKGAMLPADTVHPLRSPAKGSTAGDLWVEERIAARTPSEAELAVGEQALAYLRKRFGGDLLYARVDLLPTPDGPVLGELEIVEPSLFLAYAEGAADRFAAALAAKL